MLLAESFSHVIKHPSTHFHHQQSLCPQHSRYRYNKHNHNPAKRKHTIIEEERKEQFINSQSQLVAALACQSHTFKEKHFVIRFQAHRENHVTIITVT